MEYEQEFKIWQYKSNYLCCLELEPYKFENLFSKLDELKIKYSVFYEPDIDEQMTAVAIEAIPRTLHKKLFKNLKLTLS